MALLYEAEIRSVEGGSKVEPLPMFHVGVCTSASFTSGMSDRSNIFPLAFSRPRENGKVEGNQ